MNIIENLIMSIFKVLLTCIHNQKSDKKCLRQVTNIQLKFEKMSYAFQSYLIRHVLKKRTLVALHVMSGFFTISPRNNSISQSRKVMILQTRMYVIRFLVNIKKYKFAWYKSTNML